MIHFQPDFANDENKTQHSQDRLIKAILAAVIAYIIPKPTAGRDSANYLELTVMAGKTALIRWAEHQ